MPFNHLENSFLCGFRKITPTVSSVVADRINIYLTEVILKWNAGCASCVKKINAKDAIVATAKKRLSSDKAG
jgi:hypothetical protein